MREKLKDFEDAGAQLLVIDPHESYRVRHLLKEAGFETDDLRVPMLADPAHTVSARYGVAFQMNIHTEWSNRPATFIVDREGILRFAHRAQNFGDRPKPEAILEELGKLKKP